MSSKYGSIYFSIIPSYAGFTDQLHQFSAFYKLGLSLEYKYVHTSFSSKRSNPPRLSFLEKVTGKIYDKAPSGIKAILSPLKLESAFDVYEFLGFNQYLNSINPKLKLLDLKIINIELSDELLEESNISSFDEIKKFVRIKSKIETDIDNRNLLVKFSLAGKRKRLFFLIHSSVSEFQDSLSLRSAYFKARELSPYKSIFKNRKIKILTHVRQGDVCVLETPWDTCIPLDSRRGDWLREYNKFEDIEPGDTLFRVADYYGFLKGLISCLGDDACSILCFSDGYKRALKLLELNLNESGMSAAQIGALKRSLKAYEKRSFEPFLSLKNSQCFIGESSKKLCRLIHSTITADIIITSNQQRMIQKLVSSYCSLDRPIVIVLYKGRMPDNKDIMPMDEERFIYANLHDPDYEYIVGKVVKLAGLMN